MMKKIITLLFLAFIGINTANTLHAYTWNVKNDTDKNLIVQVVLWGNQIFSQLIQPGKEAIFKWGQGSTLAAITLNKIQYVIADDNLLKNANFLTADKSAIANNSAINTWLTVNRYKPQELNGIKDAFGGINKKILMGGKISISEKDGELFGEISSQ